MNIAKYGSFNSGLGLGFYFSYIIWVYVWIWAEKHCVCVCVLQVTQLQIRGQSRLGLGNRHSTLFISAQHGWLIYPAHTVRCLSPVSVCLTQMSDGEHTPSALNKLLHTVNYDERCGINFAQQKGKWMNIWPKQTTGHMAIWHWYHNKNTSRLCICSQSMWGFYLRCIKCAN